MNDSGINGDVLAGDDIFLCSPFSDSGTYVQYYIRAHNDDALSLSRKAEYEFYYYTVVPDFMQGDLVINEIMASTTRHSPMNMVSLMIGLKYIIRALLHQYRRLLFI